MHNLQSWEAGWDMVLVSITIMRRHLMTNRTPHLAFSLTGIYEINLPFHIAPSFTYFFPHITKSSQAGGYEFKTTVSEMMFDINGHYVFNSLDKFEFYGLAGFEYHFR